MKLKRKEKNRTKKEKNTWIKRNEPRLNEANNITMWKYLINCNKIWQVSTLSPVLQEYKREYSSNTKIP